MNAPYLTLLRLTVAALVTWVPILAQGAIRNPASVAAPGTVGRSVIEKLEASESKTFAVFVVSSNPTGEAVGGVAGTAFFTSPSEAVTAYHVLQPKSFEVPKGFTHRQIWLVHENVPSLELELNNVRFDAVNDLAYIRITKRVPARFVYQTAAVETKADRVSTEGFVANSTGPVFELSPKGVSIVSVPRLERVRLEGELIARNRIHLRAADVTLENTPCLQVTYPPIRGISGGPLLIDGRVAGVNSFGDPRGNSRTWAVELPRSGS